MISEKPAVYAADEGHDALCRRIAFSLVPGISRATACRLAELTGGEEEFFNLPVRELWSRIGAQKSYCTDEARTSMLKRAETETRFVTDNKISAISFSSPLYPERLNMCDDAPAMLFSLGPCNLNAPRAVAIVGTRRCTPYGARTTREIVERIAQIAPGTIIVSGLAYGVDIEAHKAALEFGLPTVAVVAHGLRTIYPAAHRDTAARIVRAGGAIVTEYLSDAPVHRGNFLARNRIVAGMCDATVVVESDSAGGAMVTASIASAYGREVCAVPGRTTDRYSNGPNRLIAARKASLIRGADDLAELMNWDIPAPEGTQQEIAFPELTPEMGVIVEHLRANPDATANSMVVALGIPFARLSSRLMEMEMNDFITSLPGGHFCLNI